jgi:hypothetical protein
MRALALLGLLAALVAGCGANDPLAAEEISAAAQETAAAGSSRIEISGTDGKDSFSMAGVADYEERRTRLTFSGTQDGQPQDGQIVLVGDAFYVRSDAFFDPDDLAAAPPEARKRLEGKRWLSFPVPFDVEDSLDDLVLPFPLVDPSELLRTFQEAGGEPQRLGEKDVRGVPTEGYRLQLDLARLVERAPEEHRKALRAELEGRTEKTLPVDVWIDDAGRARRFVIELEDVPATIDFFDFGVDADVQAPPQDEVFDGDEFFVTGDEESGSGTYEEIPGETIEEDE